MLQFKKAAELGIKKGDIMLWNQKLVKVVSTDTVPCTENWIYVREIGEKYEEYCPADSLKFLTK